MRQVHLFYRESSLVDPGLSEIPAPDGSQEVNGHRPQTVTVDWSIITWVKDGFSVDKMFGPILHLDIV